MTRLTVQWLLVAAAAAALLFAGTLARATALTWDANTGTTGAQDGSGTWNTTNTNWWTGSANASWSNATPDSAIFGVGGAGSHTVTLGEPITVGRLTFNAGPTYTLSGSTLTLGHSSQVTSVTTNQDAMVNSVVTGGLLRKSGAGTLTLTTHNTFGLYNGNPGYCDVSAGTLNLRHDNALGNSAYAHAASGATLELEGGITTPAANGMYIGNSTSGSTVVNLKTISGDNTWNGFIRMHSAHPWAIVSLEPGTSLTHNGVISAYNGASGSLTKIGAGPLTLNGSNLFRTPVFVNEGELVVGHANALGTAETGTTVAAGAALQIASGVTVAAEPLTLYGDGIGGTGALRSVSGTTAWNGPVTLAGTTIGVDAGTLTIGGVIDGASGLNKVGGGTLILTAANTYLGKTIIKGGTLQLAGGDNRINPATALDIPGYPLLGPATLDLNGQNQTFQGTSRVSHGGTVHLGGGGTLTLYSADLWSGSVLSGTGSFAKHGTGTVTFGSGNASYTGGTFIHNGRIACYSGSNRLPTTGDVEVTGTGIYDLNLYANGGRTQTIDGLSGDGTVRLNGVAFVVGNGNGSSDFSGLVEGGAYDAHNGGSLPNGTLTKTGTGTITLSGGNTYAGQTTVAQGILRITHGGALGTADAGTSVEEGARLQVANDITVAESLELVSTATLHSTSGNNTWDGPIAMQYLSSPTRKPRIDVSTGSVLTVNGQITGTGPWIRQGGGQLILTGDNSQTAYVDVMGGVTTMRHGDALGTQEYAHVSGGVTLEVDGGIKVTKGLYIGNTSAGDLRENLRSVTGDNEWAGYVRLHWTHEHAVIGVNGGSTLTISGIVQPSGGSEGTLTKVGDGKLILTHDNTYDAPTIVKAGVLNIQHGHALGTTGALKGTTVEEGATLEVENDITVAAEALDLTGYGVGSNGALRSTSGGNTWNGDLTMASGTRIGVDTGSTLTINGQMTVGGWWRKVGGGKLILTAANTQSNRTDIAGVVNLRHDNALGGASGGYAHVGSGSTLELEGHISVGNGLYIGNTATTDTTAGLRSVSGDNTWTGYVRLHDDHPYARIDVNGGSTLTISGIIEPRNNVVGSLTKVGDGTLIVTHANTYTGPTYVNEGTLLVNNTSGSGTGTGAVTVNGGTLGGTGAISGAVTVNAGAHVAPGFSPGILTTGILTLQPDAEFDVELLGTLAGFEYDQLDVTGSVSLDDSILNATLGYDAAFGDSFTIINNDGADAVVGTFRDLPEKGSFYLPHGGNDHLFHITYCGGQDFNDVVLTSVPEPATMTLLALGVLGLVARRRRR